MELHGDMEHIVPWDVAHSYIFTGTGTDGPDVDAITRPVAAGSGG